MSYLIVAWAAGGGVSHASQAVVGGGTGVIDRCGCVLALRTVVTLATVTRRLVQALHITVFTCNKMSRLIKARVFTVDISQGKR